MKSALMCVFGTALVTLLAQQAPAATLTGRVVDPSGAAVPGSEVHVRNLASNEIATTQTDRDGNYSVSQLPPGTYSLSVEAPGFEKSTQDGLVLKAEGTLDVDVTLKIPAVVQRVFVTAKAPELESAPETITRNLQEVLEIWQARESSAKDVGEALTKLEGVWKIRKGGIANDVVLRGFQQDNVNVLVDGVRIYGACPNNMDPPAFHVDFAELQEVKITKGPFNVKDQGSLGGVVDITSKTPAPGLRITPSLAAGSFGYYNAALTASLANKKHSGLAGYSFRRSAPFLDGNGKRFTEYANYRDTYRDTTAFGIGTAWFRFRTAPGERQRLELGYSRQRGNQVLYPYLFMDAVYDNADRLSASYHIRDLSPTLKYLRMQSYFTRVKHFMTDELRTSSVGAARPYSMATLAETRALGGRVEAQLSDLALGFEGYRRGWNALTTMRMSGTYGQQPSIPDVVMSVAGAYAEYRRAFFHKLWLNAGARLDGAKSEGRSSLLSTDLFWAYKGTRSLSQTNMNPSGNVWLAYSLRKDLEIFAGLGRTVRLPDPQERYFALQRMGTDWVGNPNLRPVRNTEVDLGLSYRIRRFSLRPTLFYSRLADYITVHNQPRINTVPSVMNAAARSYENVQARIYGGELTYSVALSRALLFSGGVSYARGAKDPNPAYFIFNPNLAEIPPLRSRAALRYGTKFFFAELEGVFAQAQGRVDTDLKEQRTPGYASMNFKLGVHAGKLNLAAGVDNLLDRFYYEHFSFQRDPFRSGVRVPEPGRSVFLTCSYSF